MTKALKQIAVTVFIMALTINVFTSPQLAGKIKSDSSDDQLNTTMVDPGGNGGTGGGG